MHRQRNILFFVMLVLFVSASLSSCGKSSLDTNEELSDTGIVPAAFTLAVPSSYTVFTKTTDAIAQAQDQPVFRGLQDVVLLPFQASGKVKGSDTRFGRPLGLPYSTISKNFSDNALTDSLGLVLNNNAHLYRRVYIPSGTKTILAYAKASDDVSAGADASSDAFRKLNGALEPNNLATAGAAAEISFSPVPVIGSDVKEEAQNRAQALADFLTDLANTSVSQSGYNRSGSYTAKTWKWSDQSDVDATIQNTFSYLTSSGKLFSGSSKSLNSLLTTVYRSLYERGSTNGSGYWTYYNPQGWSTNYYYYNKNLASAICNKIYSRSDFVTVSNRTSSTSATVSLNAPYDNFPASYGVPEGAMALRWDGTKFVVVSEEQEGTKLAPIDRYCYQPALYYYSNSGLRTSVTASVIENYVSSTTSYNTILAGYSFGRIVYAGIKAVAMAEPLSYGVAMLHTTIQKAASANLKDYNNNNVAVNNTNMPVTGIIVGEQRRQAFDFSPLSDTPYNLYDTHVQTGGASGGYRAWISSTATQSQPISTLVLQTDQEEDVHIAIEVLNNVADFTGANGCTILKGSKFYLVATLPGSQTTSTQPSIFYKGKITEVNFKIENLKGAYNTIPDLRSPQLELGLKVEADWIAVTPGSQPLY